MPLGLHLGTLVLLLFCTASLVKGEHEEINVEIASENVFLRCPEEKSEFLDSNFKAVSSTLGDYGWELNPTLLEIEKGKEFYCGTNREWKIYLKIKECKGCVELSFGLAAGIIAADLLLTLGVLLLVYFCSQRQQALLKTGAPKRLQGQQADHPPPVPNPDYEPIRKGQREVYAGLEPQAF